MKKNAPKLAVDVNRRNFIRGASLATIMSLMGGIALRAEEKAQASISEEELSFKPSGPPVPCGVIGLGPQGRDLLATLARFPNAPVLAIADTYEPMIRRARELAPKAEVCTDYRQVLGNKDVKAVLIATPTHLHREMVEDAFRAGKHVYCEAPMAHTIADARAIAQAARNHPRLNFQTGLHAHSDAQHRYVLTYFRSGATGKIAKVRTQWAKKTEWFRSSPNPEREKQLNWRLDKAVSIGLAGELGVHQLDVASWFLKSRPVAATGYGSVQQWADGREVYDTVQAVVEYPGDVNLLYDATLASSFDASYEMFYGTYATIMFRGSNAWMFKETDSPLLGWEVYARKEQILKEAGIVLRAGSTKLAQPGEKPPEEIPYEKSSIVQALAAFITNTNLLTAAIEDFDMAFNTNDPKALGEYLDGLKKSRRPAAGWPEGYEATVTGIKVNEAIVKRQRIVFAKEWFEV